MSVDALLTLNGDLVIHGTPTMLRTWLKKTCMSYGLKVRLGTTSTFLTVEEYLGEE